MHLQVGRTDGCVVPVGNEEMDSRKDSAALLPVPPRRLGSARGPDDCGAGSPGRGRGRADGDVLRGQPEHSIAASLRPGTPVHVPRARHLASRLWTSFALEKKACDSQTGHKKQHYSR